MIAKMKFINLIGEKDCLDKVIDKYLDHYEIQLENTYQELKDSKKILPNTESNPYKESLAIADELANSLQGLMAAPKKVTGAMAIALVEEFDEKRKAYEAQKEQLLLRKQKIEKALHDIIPYRNINHDIQDILDFKFIKYRFGKIPVEYFVKLKEYALDEMSTIFYQCQSDEEYIWGIYFVPDTEAEKVDAVYTSLHFERFYMPDGYEGTLDEAYEVCSAKFDQVKQEMEELEKEIQAAAAEQAADIYGARDELKRLSINFGVRKQAAFNQSHGKTFFILCGWMTEEDARRFERDTDEDPDVYCIIEDGDENRSSRPPTKLKNPRLFKPFEMFIRMYGVPDYYEMDPTIFLAITYSIMFGAMFGDVGQGLLLFVGGGLLYRYKKMELAGIISGCGLFSTIFGFLYGSIFGFEHIIEAVWLRPISAMTTLPFIGKLNTIFIVAIAVGMGLILLTMIFQIINGLKAGNLEAALFDTNGMAGLVFYGSIVTVLVLYMTGRKLPAGMVLVVMFVLPLLVMALKEPLTALVMKKSRVMPENKGMFFVQAFFELFEVLLSYFSNTLSFVRVGAFAVSHAAMMEVVLMLAGAENGTGTNWLVIILGNLFVCGMEGLIVGIQVLRLQYYEFFSRFYQGGGREFKPYRKNSS